MCPRCGAVRGGRVPLDQSEGDGAWVVATRGAADEVLRALEVRPGVDLDVLERVGAARRVVEAVGAPGAPGAENPPVSLWLDLRPAEAGHVARRTRNANVQDTVFVLPWLLVRGRELEARLVRTVHQRVRKGFMRGGAQTTTAARLDELLVVGPGGALRRPIGRLDRIAGLDWRALGLDQDAPEPAPWPATAPGQAGSGGRAPLLVGLVATLALLWVAPLLVRPFVPRDPAEALARRDREELRALLAAPQPWPLAVDYAITVGAPATDEVRLGLASREPWTRVNSLVAAANLFERPERLRRFVEVARRDRVAEVRAVALELLAAEGDLGATHLTRLIRAAELEPGLRRQALLLLADRDPPRAGAEALELVARIPPVEPLLRACYQVLGTPEAAARDPARAREVLELGTLGRDDAASRVRAAWSLANVGPPDERTHAILLAALGPSLGLSPPVHPGHLETQGLFMRALVRSRPPQAVLTALAAHPGVGPQAARVLRRALASPD
jgi:hypothetical protein